MIFLYSSSVCSCYLFLISSASVRSIPFLPFIKPIFAWNGISNFLEEISSLSHSIVFLYFFAQITEEGFLISPCYSLDLCIQIGDLSFSPLPLPSFIFSAIHKTSSDSRYVFFHFFFSGMVLITASYTMSRTSVHSSSSILSDLIPWICFSLPLYNRKGFELGHTWML